MEETEKLEKIRENLKNGILSCLGDIENQIDDILDRLMARNTKAKLSINIEPFCVITWEEWHDHAPEEIYADMREEKENGGC